MRQQSHESWLRSLTVQELQDRLEMYGWDRAEIEASANEYADIITGYRDYSNFLMTTISNELNRRKDLTKRFAVNRGLVTTPIGKGRFDRAKQNVPITDWLAEMGYPPPRQAGTRQIMSCPLGIHDDSTPSFTIYPGDRGWYCFGCNQGGTIIDLAMLSLKVNDPRSALAYLEEMMSDRASVEREGEERRALLATR